MIKGKDLIELGYTPSKWFGEALKYLNSNLDVFENKQKLSEYINTLLPPEPIEPFENPVKFHINIEPEHPDEISNVDAVMETMNEIMKVPTVVTGAVMPDACPTGEKGHIPVGGIVVTNNAIHPSMHSADVCCSVMTTNLGKIDPKEVLDKAFETTHFGKGGRKEHGGWEDLFYDNKPLVDKILDNYYTKDYVAMAAKHLGTQGDGNHFLFVGISEQTGDTHIVTHHGSRGFGAAVYKKGLHTAETFRKILSPNTPKGNGWIPYDELEGKLYWEALQIVRDWTKFNHESIHNRIINKLKIQYQDRFWNEHNFVFKDGDLFYHAKGATPLLDRFVPDSYNGLRLIPLNMSEPVLIVKGDLNDNNLGFAPHGAGRNISRAEHNRRNTNKTKEQIFKEETSGLDVRFYTGKVDISELPSAYKNADNVQKQIEKFNLGTVVDKIQPYGCIMAGEIEKFW